LVEPVGRRGVEIAGRLAQRELAEDRGAAEVLAAAVRAGRHLVALMKRHREAAGAAPEATGSRERSRAEAVQGGILAVAHHVRIITSSSRDSAPPRRHQPQFAAHLDGYTSREEGNGV